MELEHEGRLALCGRLRGLQFAHHARDALEMDHERVPRRSAALGLVWQDEGVRSAAIGQLGLVDVEWRLRAAGPRLREARISLVRPEVCVHLANSEEPSPGLAHKMAALRQHTLKAASEVVSGAIVLAAAHSRRCLGPRIRR